MSRLIFRNLPPSLNIDTFKTSLQSPPSLKTTQITDTKLVAKRRFAFVGYKTEEEAKKVRDWFDGSFEFGNVKVKVELVNDEPLAPPTKKARVQTSSKGEVWGATQPEAGPSKRLQEFMDVMKGVDVARPSEASSANELAVPGEPGWVADGQKKGKADRKPSGKGKEKAEEEEVIAEDADDDAAWLERRRRAALEEKEEQVDESPMISRHTPDEQLILSTGRLFLRNLPFVTTESDLRDHFSPFGHLESVHLPVSPKTGEPLGTAFILYRDPSHALETFRALDKKAFQGRLLHVLPGRARPGQETSGVAGIVDGEVLGKAKEAKGEVKKNVDAKRKEDSARGVNWATLYMDSDAVAASVASRMGISKAELLTGDDSNVAVKLALAETHVIEETKKYFEKEGIVLESFSPKAPRSQTTILVKNIPFGTTIPTLTDLFSPHGSIKRILLPPAGTLGVVEFENAHEAGKAFKAVSYKRMGNAVLYLEKGPVGMFKDLSTLKSANDKEEEEKRLLAEKVASADTRDAPDATDEAGSTLFIKNLSFNTTTERLTSMLSSLAGFSFARVQTKPDPKREGARLSMGYGFVGFKTKDSANRALSGLQGFEVDGKALEVKFAQRGVDDAGVAKGKGEMKGVTKSTKVLVKNLPFEATKKDVRELFSAYGQIKALRLPRKPTLSSTGSQSTRGFAFLEFTTHAEAQRAMDALKHTHLLGRHLVLQWAKEEDGVDIDELREKAGRDYRNVKQGEEVRAKKRKLEKGDGAEEMDGLDVE